MNKGLVALIVTSVSTAIATVAVVVALATGVIRMNPYVTTYEVYVSAESSRKAQGDVLVLSTNNRKTLTVQKSQCVNMNDVTPGDRFVVVVVTDVNGILQCVVKVDSDEEISVDK